MTRVQEERKSTRWTLTEWLRIKERMKMMDVWLKLFGPEKDAKTFSPEFDLFYGVKEGTVTENQESLSVNTKMARGQLWLKNLVSSTTGVRILNIDLGLDGEVQRQDQVGVTDSETPLRWDQSGAVAFRIFGRSVQDSMLTVKLGQYRRDWQRQEGEMSYSGMFAEAEMSLYLSHWIGFAARYKNYKAYQVDSPWKDDQAIKQTYMGFIEIALLRAIYGVYQETWMDGGNEQVNEQGVLSGVSIFF